MSPTPPLQMNQKLAHMFKVYNSTFFSTTVNKKSDIQEKKAPNYGLQKQKKRNPKTILL